MNPIPYVIDLLDPYRLDSSEGADDVVGDIKAGICIIRILAVIVPVFEKEDNITAIHPSRTLVP